MHAQEAITASQALTWRGLWRSGGAWIVCSGVWTMSCILDSQRGVHPSCILSQTCEPYGPLMVCHCVHCRTVAPILRWHRSTGGTGVQPS